MARRRKAELAPSVAEVHAATEAAPAIEADAEQAPPPPPRAASDFWRGSSELPTAYRVMVDHGKGFLTAGRFSAPGSQEIADRQIRAYAARLQLQGPVRVIIRRYDGDTQACAPLSYILELPALPPPAAAPFQQQAAGFDAVALLRAELQALRAELRPHGPSFGQVCASVAQLAPLVAAVAPLLRGLGRQQAVTPEQLALLLERAHAQGRELGRLEADAEGAEEDALTPAPATSPIEGLLTGLLGQQQGGGLGQVLLQVLAGFLQQQQRQHQQPAAAAAPVAPCPRRRMQRRPAAPVAAEA